MYAIVETGGKQYRVQEGDVIRVERLAVEDGEAVVLDKVLLVGQDDGVLVGTPYLQGASVSASVVTSGKGDKVIVFKYKSKKNYRRLRGHRQLFTDIRIDGITAGA
ncbi:MAG TPA: 50S ribosomal protein L21 [Synergistaceae bacterium]|nr:50S ribosomal protein L21 [Synergistaceae bacterium]